MSDNTGTNKIDWASDEVQAVLTELAHQRQRGNVSQEVKRSKFAEIGIDIDRLNSGDVRRRIKRHSKTLGLPVPKSKAQLIEVTDDLVVRCYGKGFATCAREISKELDRSVSASELHRLVHETYPLATIVTFRTDHITARDTCKAKIPQPKPVRGSWQIDTKPLDSRVRFAEPGKGYEAVSAAVVAITDADGSAIDAQLICAAPSRVASVNRFEVADVLLAAIARYGCPKAIFIDEGNEYNHRLISTIGRILGFQVKPVGGHNPTAKSTVEHLNLMIRKRAGEQYAGATTHTGFGDHALFGGSREDSPSFERVAEDLAALVDERRPTDYGLAPVPNRHLAIAVREVHETFLEMAPDDRRRRTLPATEKRHETTVHLYGICVNGRNYHNLDDSPEPEMKLSPAERLVRMCNKNGPKTVTTLPFPGDADRRIAYRVKVGQRLKYLAVVQDVKTIPLKDKAADARHHRNDVRYGQQLQMQKHKLAAEDNDKHDLTTGRLGLVDPTTPASSLRSRLANQLGVDESNTDYTEDVVMIDGQLTPIAVFQVHREPPRYPHVNEIPQPTFEDWAIARPNRLLRIKTPTWMRTEGADGYRLICRVPKM